MTHDELLAKIDEEISCAEFEERCGDGGWSSGAKALRAVVELHKPEPLDERGDVCLTCCPDLLTLYPCPTIQAITDNLK